MTSPAAILDIGCHTTKAGFATFFAPMTEFSSAVAFRTKEGHPDRVIGDMHLITPSVGQTAQDLRLPVPGQFDAELFETQVSYALRELGGDPLPTLLSEYVLEDPRAREQRAEMLIEKFGLPAIQFACSAPLAAYSTGKYTALVVDVGAAAAVAVPVVDGFALRQNAQKSDVAGNMIADNFLTILDDAAAAAGLPAPAMPRGVDNPNPAWLHWMRRETAAQILSTPGASDSTTLELPDGTVLNLPRPHNEYSGILFDTTDTYAAPALAATIGASPALPALAAAAVAGQSDRIARDLLGSVVLSGGVTSMAGFESRFTQDLRARVPAVMHVNVHGSRGGASTRLASWRGASILASAPAFTSMWVSREDWAEMGPAVLAQRAL